ncbi:flagellar hook-length control protein FliK, partial [Lysobacter xanthus]
ASPAGTAATPAVASMPAAAVERTLPPEAAAFAAFVRERPERGERATPGSDGPTPLTTALGAPREAGLVASTPRLLAVVPASAPLTLDADFDDGLAGRVTWMADQRIDRAEIRVSPEGLGTIDIRLQMDGSRVHAHFHAANADVRQALEGGIDRLRDLLGRQGMELGQAQVGTGGARDDGRAGRTPGGFGSAPSTDGAAEPAVTTVRVLRGRGLLDEYA